MTVTAQGLIDTTEMYLRTIFELEEEGVVPLRARIAERLGQSGPTVSQTVARMERDGLLHVLGDRQLALSEVGRTLATRERPEWGVTISGIATNNAGRTCLTELRGASFRRRGPRHGDSRSTAQPPSARR